MSIKKEVDVHKGDVVFPLYYTFLAVMFFISILTINYDSVKAFLAFNAHNLTASTFVILKPEVVDDARLTGEDEKNFLDAYHVTKEEIVAQPSSSFR